MNETQDSGLWRRDNTINTLHKDHRQTNRRVEHESGTIQDYKEHQTSDYAWSIRTRGHQTTLASAENAGTMGIRLYWHQQTTLASATYAGISKLCWLPIMGA